MQCGSCNKVCSSEMGQDGSPQSIRCAKCTQYYHTVCLRLSREDHKQLRMRQNNYVCPGCKVKSKDSRIDNSPIRKDETTNMSPEDNFITSAENLAKMEISPELMTTFNSTLRSLQEVFTSMKNEMRDFTQSLNFTAEDMTTFRQDLGEIKSSLKELDAYKAEVITPRAEVAQLRQELQVKEQRNLRNDVEITGLTECSGENLPQILSVISNRVGLELDSRDVDDVRRVGRRSTEAGKTARARPVVVTFTRREPRDKFLRAARVRRELTTDMFQVPGNPQRVFVNEHLTKENRVLFSKARKTGTDLKFKFVWTSNGNIFMRRSETSSVLHVTSAAVLEKLCAAARSSTNDTTSKYST